MQAHQRRNLTNKSQENSWDLLLGMVKTIPKKFCKKIREDFSSLTYTFVPRHIYEDVYQYLFDIQNLSYL